MQRYHVNSAHLDALEGSFRLSNEIDDVHGSGLLRPQRDRFPGRDQDQDRGCREAEAEGRQYRPGRCQYGEQAEPDEMGEGIPAGRDPFEQEIAEQVEGRAGKHGDRRLRIGVAAGMGD